MTNEKALLSEPAPKPVNVVGNNKTDEAKITGITPAVLILSGKWELCPPKILFPTCLLGYWTTNLLCPFSIKTINIINDITKIINSNIKIIMI